MPDADALFLRDCAADSLNPYARTRKSPFGAVSIIGVVPVALRTVAIIRDAASRDENAPNCTPGPPCVAAATATGFGFAAPVAA